jgi:hypothetical protein
MITWSYSRPFTRGVREAMRLSLRRPVRRRRSRKRPRLSTAGSPLSADIAIASRVSFHASHRYTFRPWVWRMTAARLVLHRWAREKGVQGDENAFDARALGVRDGLSLGQPTQDRPVDAGKSKYARLGKPREPQGQGRVAFGGSRSCTTP